MVLIMGNSVSNKIIQFNLKLLDSNGVDTNKIKNNLGISDYEIYKEGGRFHEELYFKIINRVDKIVTDSLIDAESIINSLALKNMYNIFPELFNYCINSASAKEAIDKFIAFRTVIGDCDELIKYSTGHESKLIYNNSIYAKELTSGAIPNFIMIFNLINCFVKMKDVTVQFMGYPVSFWMDLNDFFGVNCQWNQQQICLTLNNSMLENETASINKYLENLQEEKLALLINSKESNEDLPSYIHDMLVKKIRIGGLNNELSAQDDICSKLNLIRWTLYRRLELLGTSFTNILKQTRLKESYYYLLDTEKSIQEISELTGFSSPTSFTRFFNSNTGLSPLNYRKRKMKR